MGLAPLRPFGITRIVATTLQAISGAGYPGVPSMDINANVIPFIGGEEEKMQEETQKIMGTFEGDRIEPLAAKVSAHCNRVPVVDGHTVTVSVEFSNKPTLDDIINAFDTFRSSVAAGTQPSQRAEEARTVSAGERSSAAAERCGAGARYGGVCGTRARVPGLRLEVQVALGLQHGAASGSRALPC